ncbi:hypothetical protein AAFC00_002358 [Neodothiora populina]|uniref:Mitochondrial inner membrane protease subunit n=1 Tax=Neodothiora populina TaxID=2781224 RepID=A0ABR3PHF6_9PEZI
MSRLRMLGNAAKPALWCLATAIIINDKFFEIVSVNGPSMNPTLSPTFHETGERDYLLIDKWNATENLKRGDVISFFAPHAPETLAIKRIVGVEGDWVYKDSRRRPDIDFNAEAWDSMGEMLMVPFGHVWIEGDNFRNSRDSNWYGPISKSLVHGKAVCIVLPWKRFGLKPWEGFTSLTPVKKGQLVHSIAWEDL